MPTGPVIKSPPAAAEYGQVVRIAGSVSIGISPPAGGTGVWNYKAGVSGTPVLPAGATVTGITAHCAVAGSCSINGGDTIPIPANTAVEIVPDSGLLDPTIVFTGTDAYLVGYVI
jgi:hypothetical protein